MMKSIIKKSSGNIINGITAILIIITIIVGVMLITTIGYINKENVESMSNDNFEYIIEDYENNLNNLLLESLTELSNQVISTKKPSINSPEDIKKILNEKLKVTNKKYKEKYGINIDSEAILVENTSDPSYIQSKIKIKAEKGNEKYENLITSKTLVEGLKDPLPFLKCGKYNSLTYNETTIMYHDSLYKFLKECNVENPEGYKDAVTPLIIKKCPYDPYIHHGDNKTLENCLKNGYFHESRDGSCYLCRLEGKGKCDHYGFEVFIQASENEVDKSISASDHVIFYDQYPGERYYYDTNHSIFLDSSHRLKYGLS